MTNSPETRTLNQCTYTPIDWKKSPQPNISERAAQKEFAPKKPFQKQGLLTLVFDDPDVSELIISQMRREKMLIEGSARALLVEALQLLFQRETEQAFEILGSVKDDEFIDFVNDGLSKLSKIISNAEANTKKVISRLHDLKKQEQEQNNNTQKEKETPKDGAEPPIQPIQIAEERKASTISNIPGQVDAPDFTIPLFEASPIINTVATSEPLTRAKIQEELYAQAPMTAKFLGVTGFFSMPIPVPEYTANEVTHLLSFIKIQQDNLLFKKQALMSIQKALKVEPAGYLHLEKLLFTPVGYERGELVYSLPMLPGETVRLSHREWSKTEKEFEKIVSDSLENATEEALNEKSELSNSMKTEEKHESAFKTGVTTSGGFGPIKFSASVGYDAKDSATRAGEYSSKTSHEITSKSSSRVKHEQKISFKLSSQYEVEEQSFREISNQSTESVRWDFHRMMKKWKIDLYQYGLRLTYDMMIPEPGNYLLRKYIEIDEIEKELEKPNPFINDVKLVDRGTYEELGRKYGVAIPPPPPSDDYISLKYDVTNSEPKYDGWRDEFIEIKLPDGFELDSPNDNDVQKQGGTDGPIVYFPFHLSPIWIKNLNEDDNIKNQGGIGAINDLRVWNYVNLNAQEIRRGDKKPYLAYWHFKYKFASSTQTGLKMTLQITLKIKLTDEGNKKWQTEAYQLLSEAAAAQYQEKQIKLAERRDKLIEELQREDSLSLRKLEREEVMKGVLRWMLGPDFTFYPNYNDNLPSLKLESDGTLGYYDKSDEKIKKQYYEPVVRYSEHIKFLHQAIEWENVNYVLYPYFWTDKVRWDFKQSFFHTDFEHRNFLRAGSTRVVLTIRPGFEAAFLSYMESGVLGKEFDSPIHPYLNIADEIKKQAETTYKYTQNANGKEEFESQGAQLIDTWYEFTPTGALDVTKGTILSDSHTETGNS